MKDGFWFQTGRDDTIGKESGVCVCFPLRSTSHKTHTHTGARLFFLLVVEHGIYEEIFLFSKKKIVNSCLITRPGWPAERTNN